jgi:hypothetical protein
MQQCQSQHIPSETTMDEESSAPKAKVVDQMRYGLAHRPGQRGCLPRAKRGMGPTKVVILSWYQRIFYDTFFWMKWRMVPSHVFFLRYSTDRRWRPKLHRDACFTIDRYVHLSCFRCRPFIGVRRKAGNAAPVSLHHQTPAGTAGSGKVLVDSGQHASTDSPHLVLYRPWNCDWRKGDGVQKLSELQTRSLGRLGFIDHR